jgi:hypothetical protein
MSTITLSAGTSTIDLTNGSWCRVADGSGLFRGAALRTQNITVPRVHGEALSVLPVYGPGSVTLQLIVLGIDRTTGIQLGDGTAQLRDNLRYLTRVLHAPEVTVTHEWPDAEQVQAVGRMSQDPFEGERWVSNPPGVQTSIQLSVPGAFWQDVEPVVGAVHSLEFQETVELVEFAEASAPMDDLLITLGPGANPYLYQQGTDSVVAYRDIIEPGTSLVIDTIKGELRAGPGEAWTPDYTKLRFFPWPRWFQLDPSTGTPVLMLESSAGDAMDVQITARRKYRIGG